MTTKYHFTNSISCTPVKRKHKWLIMMMKLATVAGAPPPWSNDESANVYYTKKKNSYMTTLNKITRIKKNYVTHRVIDTPHKHTKQGFISSEKLSSSFHWLHFVLFPFCSGRHQSKLTAAELRKTEMFTSDKISIFYSHATMFSFWQFGIWSYTPCNIQNGDKNKRSQNAFTREITRTKFSCGCAWYQNRKTEISRNF